MSPLLVLFLATPRLRATSLGLTSRHLRLHLLALGLRLQQLTVPFLLLPLQLVSSTLLFCLVGETVLMGALQSLFGGHGGRCPGSHRRLLPAPFRCRQRRHDRTLALLLLCFDGSSSCRLLGFHGSDKGPRRRDVGARSTSDIGLGGRLGIWLGCGGAGGRCMCMGGLRRRSRGGVSAWDGGGLQGETLLLKLLELGVELADCRVSANLVLSGG
mmetsp:Transcript_71500/g.168476  ORF Transcript_71500/g.168476 Transcript_71500/m.168476 type:complete len:214 (-) Transcript_71500:330-971(-)